MQSRPTSVAGKQQRPPTHDVAVCTQKTTGEIGMHEIGPCLNIAVTSDRCLRPVMMLHLESLWRGGSLIATSDQPVGQKVDSYGEVTVELRSCCKEAAW